VTVIEAERPGPTVLLDSAIHGNHKAFGRLIEPHRGELKLHCYRMTGSLHDAEDLIQETLLRAWRGLGSFERRGSFRAWLYRIATNVCLNALASRASASRLLPELCGPASEQMPQGGSATEVAWLEPYPDSALDRVMDMTPGPDSRYEMREAVQLAFIAAIQFLPPPQRAVLLLRDVLGWSSIEAAHLLETSVASVNSRLQRARTTIAQQLKDGRARVNRSTSERERDLLDRYVRAWEAVDLESFVALLKHDAIYSMPPWREWYQGRESIRRFFETVWRSGSYADFRITSIRANGSPAFAVYARKPGSSEWQAHSIQHLVLHGDAIAVLTGFKDPNLFSPFGLPLALPS